MAGSKEKKKQRRSRIMVIEKDGEKYEVEKNSMRPKSLGPDAKLLKDEDERKSPPEREPAGSSKEASTQPNSPTHSMLSERGSKREAGTRSPDIRSRASQDDRGSFGQSRGSASMYSRHGSDRGSGSLQSGRMGDDARQHASEEDFHTAEESSTKGGQSRDRAVGFNENMNTERKVERDANKGIPVEQEEKNMKEVMAERKKDEEPKGTLAPNETLDVALEQGCDLENERVQGNVAYEGTAYKRRWFCFCFWTKNYFVLTKDGIIKYYNHSNRSSPGKPFVKTSDLDVVSRVDREKCKHKYQINLEENGREKKMAFDDSEVRDAWAMKISEVIRNNRGS